MLTTKIRINPTQHEVTYEIEGTINQLQELDLKEIEKLNTIVNRIASVFKSEEKVTHQKKNLDEAEGEDVNENNVTIEINIPTELIDAVQKLDERIRFPILWYFSNQKRMAVKDFLLACARKGVSLSSSWHPSAGGNFKKRLVGEDKMFHEDGKVGGQTAWKLTDVGELKVTKEIERLHAATNNGFTKGN